MKTNKPAATPVKKAPASPADLSFAAAQEALKRSNYSDGRRLFGDFLGRFPTDERVAEAQFLKGMCELKGGPEGAAMTTWNSLIGQKPQSDAAARALEQLALYYEEAGPPTRVEEMLNRLKTSFPTNTATVRLWTKRGDELFAAKKYDAAVQAWGFMEPKLSAETRQQLVVARLLAQTKSDPASLLAVANASMDKNAVASAIGLYEAYLDHFPRGEDVAQVKTKLGWAYYVRKNDGDTDRAEGLWRDVAKQGPVNDQWVGESQWHMVQLLAGPRGKWEEAVQVCTVITKGFPVGTFRHEQAMFSKAWLYWVKKQWVKSKTAFEELIAAYPEKQHHPPIIEYLEDCEKGLATGQKKAP